MDDIHVIVMPMPPQGHVIPAVHLALKLASNGFKVTFINTEFTHQKITNSHGLKNDDDIFVAACESGLDIAYRTVNDGFPLSFDRAANMAEYLEGLMSVMPGFVDELVGEIVKNDSDIGVSCLIVDTFFGWQSRIAEKYDLVLVSFWTEPALVFNIYYHMELLQKNGHFGSLENRSDTIDYIPGVKTIEPKDLPSYLQETNCLTTVHKFVSIAFKDVKRADFILSNTIQDLEHDTILALQDKQPFFSIGPIFPPNFTKSIVPTSLRPEFDCTKWLDTKPLGSVLYVSFGSSYSTSKDNMDEIVHGLAFSGVNFVWVIRPNMVILNEPYSIPIEVEDKVKENGLIVTWTNQLEVLSHPSTGGFLTHCGWNSVLESAGCGVPMLCFPLKADQITNRRLVVDDWKVGLNLCDKKQLTRFEVESKIKRLMFGKSGNELRGETMNVRKLMKNAVAKDGSSQDNFLKFITHVKAKVNNKSKK